jgi:hypothetical protein
MNIDKTVAIGMKKKPNFIKVVMFPILLTSALCVNHTLSLKAQDMQRNCRTCSETSHC